KLMIGATTYRWTPVFIMGPSLAPSNGFRLLSTLPSRPMASRAVSAIALGAFLAGFGARSLAQSASGSSAHGADVGVALRAGTLGVGVEVYKWLVNHVGARVGVNYFTVNLNSHQQTDITFDAQ